MRTHCLPACLSPVALALAQEQALEFKISPSNKVGQKYLGLFLCFYHDLGHRRMLALNSEENGFFNSF